MSLNGTTCKSEHRSARPSTTLGQALSLEGRTLMLFTIVVVLVILWALGLATAYTAGGLIHVLLVIAIIVVLLRIIQGRNPLKG